MSVERTLQSIADVLADHEAAYHPGQLCPEDQHGHCAARPRPVPSPEDRMADARTDTAFHRLGQQAAAIIQPAASFATYLDATERDQLDARAVAAEQERDDALQDRDEARQTAKDLYGTLKTIERERNEAIEARDVLRHQLDHYRAVTGRLRDQAAEAAGWEFIADQLTEQRNILRAQLDAIQPLIAAAQTWRTWYGNTNPSYASACNDLAAAIDALPPSSVPPRRAQEDDSPAVWTVPKVAHDQNRAVGPRVHGRWVHRAAGQSDPEHTRLYAALLLAAADEAEKTEG